MIKIGITERSDAGLDFSWIDKSKKYDGVILITKYLSDKFIEEASKVDSIIHATITGLGGTVYEPNVKSWLWSVEQFIKLVNVVGKDRVVLRIDPIIPNNEIAAFNVYNSLHHLETRVRISFLDNYPHVKARFIRAGLQPLPYNFHAPLSLRRHIYNQFNNKDIEVCGEPGFSSIGCVSEKDLKILGLELPKNVKRGYQRLECPCLSVKHEIFTESKQCPNRCLYCYWK